MKTKRLVFFLIILFQVFIPLRPQDYDNTEIISVEKTQEIKEKILQLNLDLLMEGKGRIYIVASHDDLLILEKEKISYAFETGNFYPYNQRGVSIQGGINGKYHSYQELEEDMLALEKAYPRLARVFDIGDSLEKRNIYALKISDNVELDEEEAEVIFLGCHHAREWISVEIPFLFGKYLAENYDSNPEIKSLVDQSEIWIVPLVNPDGLEYSIHFYRYWRKNRRVNRDGSYGIDLNRNYGYMWGYDNLGSSPNPPSEVYRGQYPFSEPETQVVRDLFLQKNFQAMISYHSYSQIIMYPWGYTKLSTEKDSLLQEIAAKMADLIQAVNRTRYDYGQAGSSLYLTNGDITDWTFAVSGIPSYTIELPPVDQIHGGFFNAEEDINSIFQENLPAMLYLIELSIQSFESKKTFPEGKN